MTSGKTCVTWRSACMAVCAAMFAGVSALAGTGPRDEGPAAFIWDADHGMRDLTDLLIDEYGIDLGGSILISANGISADGRVMWGEKVPLGDDGARYWKLTLDGDSAEYRPLVELQDNLPGSLLPQFKINAMSRDGNVFGGYVRTAPGVAPEAMIWSEDMGIVRLGRVSDGPLSEVSALSFDGTVAVGRSGNAFRWSAETGIIGLGDLPGGLNFSWALGVSDDGSVVVGNSSSTASGPSLSLTEAFRWTEQTGMIGLGDLPGGFFGSEAISVSGDGTIAGGSSFIVGSQVLAIHREGAWMSLGFRPGAGFGFRSPIQDQVNAISFDGSFVVGSVNFNGIQAFLWSDDEGLLFLGDLPGGEFFSTAYGVSDDGRIVVGSVQVPEPATLTVVAMIGIAIACRSRLRVTGDSQTRAPRKGAERA